MQVYLWFPEPLNVQWEEELLVIELLSSGTRFRFGRQTPSLLLRLGFKPSFLINYFLVKLLLT